MLGGVEETMKTGRRLLILGVILTFTAGSSAFGCWVCRTSPNGWGFCRSGYNWGHTDCREEVRDAWTGQTKCVIYSWEWGQCGVGIGDGEPCLGSDCPGLEYASQRPCAWTDRPALSLV